MKTVDRTAQLIAYGKEVIAARDEDAAALCLSGDFLEGFREGVAELIGHIVGESANDILAQLD
jgi:hypothetical protein